MTRFLLGTHCENWLWSNVEFPLFVSRNRLLRRKSRFPKASVPFWALDSGGFTEINTYGMWRISATDYAECVIRFDEEIGRLLFVAPQDWMCEDAALEASGKTVREHQELTVSNFLELRDLLGTLVIPVLQGNSVCSYQTCRELYESARIDLASERIVGLGSVCRRQQSSEIRDITKEFQDVPLHGFGVKSTGLRIAGKTAFSSVDSMSWSFDARRTRPLEGCTHKNCANCLRYATIWRTKLLNIVEGLC